MENATACGLGFDRDLLRHGVLRGFDHWDDVHVVVGHVDLLAVRADRQREGNFSAGTEVVIFRAAVSITATALPLERIRAVSGLRPSARS
jgi:hypothetical protein